MPCKCISLRRRHTRGKQLRGRSCPYPNRKLLENCIFFTIWKQRPAFRIKVTSCLLRRPSTEQWVWGFKQEGPVREVKKGARGPLSGWEWQRLLLLTSLLLTLVSVSASQWNQFTRDEVSSEPCVLDFTTLYHFLSLCSLTRFPYWLTCLW